MAKKQSPRKSAQKASRPAQDAIQLLRADHANVQKLFKEFEKTANEITKQKLATKICNELKVHTAIEEEIFYPAAREVLEEEDLLDEAEVEHASAKELIAQIEKGSPDDDLWCAKVTVLGEYINHHVKEEQDEMFPKIKKSGMNLKTLGKQMRDRKAELIIDKPLRKSSRKDEGGSARVSA